MATEPHEIDLVTADPALADSLVEALQTHGLRVRVCSGIKDFVEDGAGRRTCAFLNLAPGVDGLNAEARRLLRARPTVVTASSATVALAVEAMREGAIYFLEQPIQTDELSLALAACALGGRQDPMALLMTLSRRERDVLEGVVRGESSKVSALRLGISPRTVECHRARMRSKLGVPTVPALIGLMVGVTGWRSSEASAPS